MKISITKNNMRLPVRIIASTCFCLAIWSVLSIIVDNSYFLPGVHETFLRLVDLLGTGRFYLAILFSVARVIMGLLLGIFIGVALAILSHLFAWADYLISPIVSIMKATPIATIILILWFTFTDTSLAVFVVFLMVTPIVWQNVYDGFKSIPKELVEVCEIYQFSFRKKMKILVFPALMKYFIPAVITSIGLAWKAEIAAEIMTYSNIGRSIQDFKTLHYDTASVFAWAVVIVVLSLILESGARYFLRRVRV